MGETSTTRFKVAGVVTAGLLAICLCVALAFGMAGGAPTADADESADGGTITPLSGSLPDSILLGVFTNSQSDQTDSFYMSDDGLHFELISQAFYDLTPQDPATNQAAGSFENGRTWPLYAFNCPSIIWHNGYFWMLSNESNSGDDYTLRLAISNSKDLIHWADQQQLKVPMPGVPTNNGTGNQFDVVGADWAVAPDGTVYAVACAGRYGDFHGDAQNDEMYPYLIRFNNLSAFNDPASNPKDTSVLQNVSVNAAIPINLPEGSVNRIDGSLYFEGNTAFLSIKDNGVENEIWRTSNLGDASNPGSWSLVNGCTALGYEAPSLVRFKDVYYQYVDKLFDFTPDDHYIQPDGATGTAMIRTTDLAGGWTDPILIQAYRSNGQSMTVHNTGMGTNAFLTNGPRHGTVITVTDPSAIQAIYAARAQSGWGDRAPIDAPFLDTPLDAWYMQPGGVSEAVSKGLMNGVGSGPMRLWFEPDGTASRAMVVAVMCNMLHGNPGSNDVNTGFSDVPPGAWYTGVVAWAAERGLVAGYPDGRFDPDAPVTREQLATMLGRYAGYVMNGNAEQVPDADHSVLNAYGDGASVSDYAKNGTSWCVAHGIIGKGISNLDPLALATRAQLAAMFVRTSEAV